MALGLTNRGSGTHNTGATSFGLSPASNPAAGSLVVLCVSADNSSSGGATNDLGTVTDSLGNTWTRHRNPIFDNGAASAGVQTAIYSTPQNAGAITTGTTITVATPSSPVAKSWTLTEVTHAANAEAVVIGGADQAGATTASPSFASSSIPVGQAVLFMVGMESGTTQTATADADTTNGSWSTQQYAEIGSTTSGSCIASQGKVQTTTASTQTYNPTLGISSDLLVSYVIIREQHTASVSHTATGGGAVAITKTTARSRSETDTGGGVLAVSKTTNRNRSAVDTGGGVATAAATSARSSSAAATGGGIATIDAEAESTAEAHEGSVVATGGGVLTASASSSRSSSPTPTGAGVGSAAIATSRLRSATATGAGAVVATGLAGRATAATATGGGTFVLSASSSRLAAVSATGGGVAVIDDQGATPAAESSPAATGGGVLTIAWTSGRSTGATATGGGVVVVDAEAGLAPAIDPSGPGPAMGRADPQGGPPGAIAARSPRGVAVRDRGPSGTALT